MTLSEICIKRPVFTVVISLVLILLGVLGYMQLELRANPRVFRPRLVVMVEVPGSSAEFVEKNVVIPLENNLQSTSYLSYMYSTSSQGFAQIRLNFKNITPEEFLTAQSEVMQEVNQTQLPQNAERPEIRSAGRHGNTLMFLSVSAKNMGQHRLVDYVYNNIVRRLQQVQGVGSVQQYSTRNALRIDLLPKKMAQMHISTQDVITALQDNDVSVQAGQVVNKQQAIPINLKSTLSSVQEFENLIIKRSANRIVHLKDIAVIRIDHKSYAGAYTYYNGQQGVGINIVASDNANPIAVGAKLQRILREMQRTLPPGMKFHVLWNEAKLIRHSVEEVFWTIFEAVVLVALVTLLFLGRFRFATIPLVTIPVCIISAFAGMWLFGFSINLMTLLALVLAVGLVVDDAIVVLENSHRHVEGGLAPMQAAIKSMKEITFPVIGMTISVIAVYIPTAFMRGKTAVYFQQFAFTLAAAVFISGIIALTLTPMMCSRLMTKVSGKGFDAKLEVVFGWLRRNYHRILSWVLRHRWLPILLFLILLAGGFGIFRALPSTLIPKEYGGFIFVGVKTPASSSVFYTEKVAKKVIAELKKMPQISGIMSFGGGTGDDSNFGANFVRLKEKYRDAKDNIAIAGEIAKKFANLPQAQVFAVPVDVSGSRHSQGQPGQLFFYVTGFASYPQLSNAVKNYVAALNETKMFQQVDNGMKYSSQQYDIGINRVKSAQLSVPIANVVNSISTFLGGYTLKDGYQFNGVNYPVIVQLPVSDLADLNILQNIFVSNANNVQVPLSRLVNVKSSVNLPQRVHVNGMRAGSLDVVANSNYSMGQVVKEMRAIAKKVLPPGMNLQFTRRVLDMLHGNYTMVLIFGMGLLFIYLVLAALFESFIDPFIILLTVPLCIVGAIAVLLLIGGSLNIYTGIGLVTLIGLVSKHGVLITQFANRIREDEGKSITESVLEAATIRIRPILMTTATMIIGALPLVLSGGVGSNSRHQIGYVIIAGMLVGTFFSLFVVPVAYSIFARFKHIKNQ